MLATHITDVIKVFIPEGGWDWKCELVEKVLGNFIVNGSTSIVWG